MNNIRNLQLTTSLNKPILVDVIYEENGVKKPVIIFAHGIKCFKDWGTFNLIADYFADKGFVFVKFNFSHCGTTLENQNQIIDLESFANNNISIELDDMNEIINWVVSNENIPDDEIDREDLNLIGHSRGGSLCILQANNDSRIKKLVTWSAFNDFDWVFNYFFDLDKWKKEGVYYADDILTGQKLPRYYQHYENYIENKKEFNIKKAIKSIEIPVLVIHGTEDEMVPFENAIDIKRWNKKVQLYLVPNGSHRFGGFHPFPDIVVPFDTKVVLEETLGFLTKK